jgi:hypothetical protein
MRGGAQSHLMRCSDGYYYVVKFKNNPQHRRTLANEFLGTKLAALLGLPTTPVAIIEVTEELIRHTSDLAMQMPRRKLTCEPGLQFGSRYPGDPRKLAAFDFLPDNQLKYVSNLEDFVGMLVFDKWTCNTDGRQTVFLKEEFCPGPFYRAVMVDQGFCFNAGEWNFPDAPLRGLYARNRVYDGVTGMESFAPWLERLEEQVTEATLAEITGQIPVPWYEYDDDGLLWLSQQLLARRSRVPEMLVASAQSDRQPFPNWVPKTKWTYLGH